MTEKTTSKEKNPRVEEAREHFHAAQENMRKVAEAWLPEGVSESQRNAQKEFLLALRSLLDAAIELTDKQQTK